MLGLRFCARAFSSCGERGPLFIAVRGPLTVAASLVAEHGLQTCRLSSCGSRAQLLRGTWDLPRPGLEPVSPALAGRFSTTAPPGKSPTHLLLITLNIFDYWTSGWQRVDSSRKQACVSWESSLGFPNNSRPNFERILHIINKFFKIYSTCITVCEHWYKIPNHS